MKLKLNLTTHIPLLQEKKQIIEGEIDKIEGIDTA